jgi:opacity protein-like surface antigen
MKRRNAAGWMACLVLLAPTAEAAEPTTVQVVPFGGFRVGGSLEDSQTAASRDLEEAASFGLALELRYADGEDRWLQLWYSRQGSEVRAPGAVLDLDVEYLHLGGTAPISDTGRVQSYVSAGMGATRLTPRGAGLDDTVEFSGSLGLGLSIPVSERVALRLEARGYLTLVDPETSIFCRSDAGGGACRIVASGSTLFQAEFTAGIVFGF